MAVIGARRFGGNVCERPTSPERGAATSTAPRSRTFSLMGRIHVVQEGPVGAPAQLTYGLIADDEHHQRFLPEGITNFEVLEGGVGAGTLHRFKVTAGGRVREYVMRVDEPQPGSVITETDQNSSLVTTFTVTPAGEGCVVRIETAWNGAGGIGGFFERTFAPRVMRRMYADELTRLDTYAREQQAACVVHILGRWTSSRATSVACAAPGYRC